jgi:7-cyano-7-deazaguanine synthase in queuosine biosynthesis
MVGGSILQVVGNPHATGKIKDIKEPSSIIMLSGGIDSVGVLKRILEETDEKIYAHHIHIKNNTGAQYKRYRAEAEAVRKIVPYMKRTFRDFHYSESTVDIRQLINLLPTDIGEEEEDKLLADSLFLADMTYYNFIGGLLAKITQSSIIYTGTCKEDYDNNDSWSSGVLKRMENGLKQLNATSYPFEVTPRRPHNNQSKRESIEYLGKELMEMVWYCREPSLKNNRLITCITKQEEQPKYQIFCCHACALVRDALLEIEEGKEYMYG